MPHSFEINLVILAESIIINLAKTSGVVFVRNNENHEITWHNLIYSLSTPIHESHINFIKNYKHIHLGKFSMEICIEPTIPYNPIYVVHISYGVSNHNEKEIEANYIKNEIIKLSSKLDDLIISR